MSQKAETPFDIVAWAYGLIKAEDALGDFIELKPGESLKYMGGFMPQLTGEAAIKAAKAGRKIIEAEARKKRQR